MNLAERRAPVAVLGAGTMGAGIAQVAAVAGHNVRLYDVSADALQQGRERIAGSLRRGVEKGRHDTALAEAALERVSLVTDIAAAADAALVIEAAPEDLRLKRQLLSALEEHLDANAILASNTSTLPIGAIASGLQRPEMVCGMHFFNPAPVMPLVEVVRSFATGETVVAEVVAVAEAWGKTPIVAADTPGFIVNRVARPFYGEALRMLGEGVSDIATIDRLVRDAGFPMGPFQLMDLIGIDVNLAAAEAVYDGFFQDPRFRPHPIQRSMVESGRLGRKTGQGYYRYDEAR